jgi:Peptidase C13 family
LAPVLASAACASDDIPQTRYQLSQTRPDDIANPQAKQDAPSLPSGPFAHWAAVIVAGDDTSSDGKTTEAFDNARKDLASAFVNAGFARDHIFQFSSAPKSSDPTEPGLANVDAVKGGLHRLLGVAGQGCLIYVTSHGNTRGIKFGEKLASPDDIAGLADRTCGDRPTIMILSACHAGVFVQPLEAANRMVMSAARSDRSSFGCGTTDKYPYFGQCMISSLGSARNFIALTGEVKSCVSRMEQAEHFPPSEPQLAIGQSIEPLLTGSTFASSASFNVAACADQPKTVPCPAKTAPPASSSSAAAR